MSFSREIPKIIHVIWAGGAKNMPLVGIENIIEWAILNTEFEIWLWVDRKTSDPDIITDYTNLFMEEVDNQIASKQNQENPLTPINLESVISRIKFQDIQQNNLRDEYVAYEIDKLRPNYGSSSDILRYKILYQHGGAYIDCTDVGPNPSCPITNSSFYNTVRQKHLLCVDHLSQESKPDPKALSQFNRDRIAARKIGNDTFICSPQNPLMKKIIEKVQKNYDKDNDTLETRIRHAHDSKNIKDETIERTGPQVIGDILEEYLNEDGNELSAQFQDGEEKHYVEIKPIRSSEEELTIPRGNNTQIWLKAGTVYPKSEEEFFTSLKNTVAFEIKHLKILRLDDHIDDYIDFLHETKSDNINATEKTTELIGELLKMEALNEIDVYVQITGKFQTSIDLCKTRGWNNFYDLEEKKRLTAARYQSNLVFIREIIGTRLDEAKEYLLNALTTKLCDPEENDKERLQKDLKVIQANIFFKLKDYRKIIDEYNIKDSKIESLILLGDLDSDKKELLVKLMKKGLEFLEFFIEYSQTTFSLFESAQNLVKDCIYFSEILNASVSLSDLEKPAKLISIEKASRLLNILEQKALDLTRVEPSAEEDNRSRKGPSCCNIP